MRPLALLVVLAWAPTGSAADLFVDAAGVDAPGCQAAAPCATVAHALTQASPAGGDVIHVGDGTFVGTIVVDRSVTVEGAAAAVLDGGGAGTVLRWEQPGDLVLRGLTITGGDGGAFNGGGLHLVGGSVTIEDCRITSNVSGTASAIRHQDGSLVLRRTEISDNGSPASGVAVSSSRGSLVIESCTIARNIGGGNGMGLSCGVGTTATVTRTVFRSNIGAVGRPCGGIYVDGIATVTDCEISDNEPGGIHVSRNGPGRLTLERTTVTGNRGSSGGGVANWGTLVMRDCVVSDNTGTSQGAGIQNVADAWIERSTIARNVMTTALGDGGGVYVADSTATQASLTIVNSTITGNRSQSDGGGIHCISGCELHAYNCTIADNVAETGLGGGIYVRGDSTCEMGGGIVSGNAASQGNDVYGAWVSLGHSLVTDANGWSAAGATATDLVGVDPLLAPLADNGGTGPTHALGAGSPALDSGDPAGCLGPGGAVLDVDQRRRARPADGDCDSAARCDRGAVEWIACVGALTLYESQSPQDVATPARAVANPTASPYTHVPAAGPLLFHQVDDGAGWPALIRVARSGQNLIFTW